MDENTPSQKQIKWYLAVLLTIIQPGLGHMYCGKLCRGLLLYIPMLIILGIALSTTLLHTFSYFAIFMVVMSCLYLLMVVDVIRVSKPGVCVRKKYHAWYFYVCYVVCGMAIGVYIQSDIVRAPTRVTAYKMQSEKMGDALRKGEYFHADVNAYAHREPSVGEIVIVATPAKPEMSYVLRVVAQENDFVSYDANEIRVNGESVVARNPSQTPEGNGKTTEMRTYFLKKGEYFVAGDTAAGIADSRYFGVVTRKDFVGKPLYIYWSSDLARIGTRF